MDNKIRWQPQPIIPPKTTGKQLPVESEKTKSAKTTKFQGILKDKILEEKALKFSKHAQQRIRSRNIIINESDILKINKAVDKAAEKGVKDSLILFENIAFVVSVKNRIVITAVDGENLKENVFTNIDGAVII